MIKKVFIAGILMATMVTVKTYAQENPQKMEKGDPYKNLDKDGDGKLSRGEVESVSQKDKNADLLFENFNAIDKNKDGFLDRGELAAFRKNPPRTQSGG